MPPFNPANRKPSQTALGPPPNQQPPVHAGPPRGLPQYNRPSQSSMMGGMAPNMAPHLPINNGLPGLPGGMHSGMNRQTSIISHVSASTLPRGLGRNNSVLSRPPHQDGSSAPYPGMPGYPGGSTMQRNDSMDTIGQYRQQHRMPPQYAPPPHHGAGGHPGGFYGQGGPHAYQHGVAGGPMGGPPASQQPSLQQRPGSA